jgi:hypothetical protein
MESSGRPKHEAANEANMPSHMKKADPCRVATGRSHPIAMHFLRLILE